MDKYTDVNYKEIPKDEECYVTAVKIGEILDLPASTIRKWAEYHEDNLYIKKTKGRFSYTEKSIGQFKDIKEMKFGRNMTHEQIKIHMGKRGKNLGNYDGGLINPEDPFGYDVLATKISRKNEQMLKDFLNTFMQYQQQENSKFIDCIRDEVSLTTQEQVKESMSIIESQLQLQKEDNVKLNKQIEEMKKELALTKESNEKLEKNIGTQISEQTNKIHESLDKIATSQENRDIQISNNYKELLKQRREEIEKNKNQEEKQGFLSKIFKRCREL
ncbi:MULTISPECIES: MerR family transcriptional regulator [unclassified Clostridium]|uniref:MerR family transcriptional regulator n=1 Tax=unclassified Clostridium TaxID=2614128 RepID=UPI002079FF2A|nr:MULTISPECIES: MerR family transcriptional regulator [unclassified Clostridium]